MLAGSNLQRSDRDHPSARGDSELDCFLVRSLRCERIPRGSHPSRPLQNCRLPSRGRSVFADGLRGGSGGSQDQCCPRNQERYEEPLGTVQFLVRRIWTRSIASCQHRGQYHGKPRTHNPPRTDCASAMSLECSGRRDSSRSEGHYSFRLRCSSKSKWVCPVAEFGDDFAMPFFKGY